MATKYCKDRLRENCKDCDKEDIFGDVCHAYQAYHQGLQDGIMQYKKILLRNIVHKYNYTSIQDDPEIRSAILNTVNNIIKEIKNIDNDVISKNIKNGE